MKTELNLQSHIGADSYNGIPSVERIEGALAFSAIGDALGWPTEFGRYPASVRDRFGKNWVTDFVPWKKFVGGRFWGYEEQIGEGEYSDDTQLTLSVARCIDDAGCFDVEKFAYLELPSWILYEKGGGRSIKAAARHIISKKGIDWRTNFYRICPREGPALLYEEAGANGAAMRVLPLAIVNINNNEKLIRDCFANAIVTHGHPRAILGSILYGCLLRFLLTKRHVSAGEVTDYLKDIVHGWTNSLAGWEVASVWRADWDRRSSSGKTLKDSIKETNEEAVEYLDQISSHLEIDHKDYYRRVGALDRRTKGSGLATVLTAVYMFLKYLDEPETAVIEAVNTIGSDTDTIGYFIGGLFGAYMGMSAVPGNWLAKLQDRDYFTRTAMALRLTLLGDTADAFSSSSNMTRQGALMSLYAWEIGLHELFWEALDSGSPVIHPALGRGVVQNKEVKQLPRKSGYIAKLVRIKFDCGQTCTFHSRVSSSGTVSESLTSELRKSLDVQTAVSS
ncbi:MAG: ADP-ribosylglycohydrolase family protein [Acidobacteriota bacterium]